MGGPSTGADLTALAMLYALCAVAALGVLGGRRANRQTWADIRGRDWCVHGALASLGAWVSLHHFDAIANHAVEHHEETLVFAFQGIAQPGTLHPLEVHPLLLAIYTGMGQLTGGHMAWFVATALLLGGLGSVFAGAAAQLLTRKAWIGWTLALLLALHPSLAYWRVQGFHVAPPHAAFCATLLAAVLVSRKPDLPNLSAWLVLGGFTLSFRPELAGAVVGTALLPLLCGPKRWWADIKGWLPGLLASALLLAPTLVSQLGAVSEREDYWTGLRFVPIHLGVAEFFQPVTFLPILIASTAAVLALFLLGTRDDRRLGAALLLAAGLGLFPAICFSGFGPRHLLPVTTVLLLLLACGLGVATVGSGSRRTALTALGLVLVAWGGVSSWGVLQDMGNRYGIDTSYVPSLPDTERPSGDLLLNPNLCFSYSGSEKICSDWRLCLPPKDLRDPVRVRERWNDSPGDCVLWALDDREDDVRGVRHESWMILRQLYDWEPVGVVVFEEDGGLERRAEVYSLRETP